MNGLYEVSNLGNVRSLKYRRQKENKSNTHLHLMRPSEHKDGYYMLVFTRNYKRKMKYIHRLVAETFIPNPNNLLEVNHKDGNKQNNKVNNLEWCSRLENIRHIYTTGLKKTGKYLYNARKVKQYSLDNKLIAIYETQTEASKKLKINQADISRCCRGLRNKAGGYIWKYADEKSEERN